MAEEQSSSNSQPLPGGSASGGKSTPPAAEIEVDAQLGSLEDLESKARQARPAMVAQFHQPEVNPEDIVEAAFDVKKAAQRADELQTDGAKYCGWHKARVDASDLETAISRHLLNHGTVVPDHVLASKIWRVSFIAADLIDQLALGGAQCALLLRHSSEAHSLFGEYASVTKSLQDLTFFKFDQLASRQTVWREEANLESLRNGQQNDPETLKVQLRSVLVAAREMKESAEAANKATRESGMVSECLGGGELISEPASLNALIDSIERSPTNYFLLASNMSNAYIDAESAGLLVDSTLQGCSIYAAEKKKAANMVTEAIGAHHRLRKAIVEFESLVVRQAEWEEQTVQKQIVPLEQ